MIGNLLLDPRKHTHNDGMAVRLEYLSASMDILDFPGKVYLSWCTVRRG